MKHETESHFPPYVSRPILNGEELATWSAEQGLRNAIDPAHMHVTVLYSKTSVNTSAIPLLKNFISVNLRDARPFRVSSALAMPVDHPKIWETHERYLAIGATHDYADGVFRPHVTLKYDATEQEVERLYRSAGFTGCLELGEERKVPLRSGWRP